MSDLTSPISTYDLPGWSFSGLIDDNCLFLGSSNQIIVFEISTSLTEPLKRLAIIETSEIFTFTMMKWGTNIILGECNGYLQVFDIQNLKITHTQQFEEIGAIFDFIANQDSEQLLLAGDEGVLKATKDQAIKHYFRGKLTLSICHIAESFYLVGL